MKHLHFGISKCGARCEPWQHIKTEAEETEVSGNGLLVAGVSRKKYQRTNLMNVQSNKLNWTNTTKAASIDKIGQNTWTSSQWKWIPAEKRRKWRPSWKKRNTEKVRPEMDENSIMDGCYKRPQVLRETNKKNGRIEERNRKAHNAIKPDAYQILLKNKIWKKIIYEIIIQHNCGCAVNLFSMQVQIYHYYNVSIIVKYLISIVIKIKYY